MNLKSDQKKLRPAPCQSWMIAADSSGGSKINSMWIYVDVTNIADFFHLKYPGEQGASFEPTQLPVFHTGFRLGLRQTVARTDVTAAVSAF